MSESESSTPPASHSDQRQSEKPFSGFQPLTANFIYCPNQFLDLCLPHSSRGVVRLVGYLLRRTLGWLDKNGDPIEQEIAVSYREIIADAGISRGGIRDAIDESLRRNFIRCTRTGQKAIGMQAALTGSYALQWDPAQAYVTSLESFHGLYAGEGYRTPIPNAFFDRVIRQESLAVIRIIGTVLRHTVGYQNQFGGRRTECPLSYSYLQSVTNIHDRTTLSRALQTSIQQGYIRRVEDGHFDPNGERRKAATYAVRWLDEGIANAIGSKTRPVSVERSKNPTSHFEAVQKPDQLQFRNPTSDRPKTRPENQFKNPTHVKTLQKDTYKQQATDHAVVENVEGIQLLRRAGFDGKMATMLSRHASAEEITKQIEWLKVRNPQRNPLRMLRRAIEDHWSAPATTDIGLNPPRSLDRELEIEVRQAHLRSTAEMHKQDRLTERSHLLQQWHRLSASEQAACRQQAIDQAPSETVRRLLLRHQDLRSPPNEILDMMVREFSTPHL